MVPRRAEVIKSVVVSARCLSAAETIVQANRRSRGVTYPNIDGQALRTGERPFEDMFARSCPMRVDMSAGYAPRCFLPPTSACSRVSPSTTIPSITDAGTCRRKQPPRSRHRRPTAAGTVALFDRVARPTGVGTDLVRSSRRVRRTLQRSEDGLLGRRRRVRSDHGEGSG